MNDHIVKDIEVKMVELANGKGTFIFEIVLDWTDFKSNDPVFDFADHLVKILEE